MNCSQCRALLSGADEGAFDPRALVEHLRTCAGCRAQGQEVLAIEAVKPTDAPRPPLRRVGHGTLRAAAAILVLAGLWRFVVMADERPAVGSPSAEVSTMPVEAANSNAPEWRLVDAGVTVQRRFALPSAAPRTTSFIIVDRGPFIPGEGGVLGVVR